MGVAEVKFFYTKYPHRLRALDKKLYDKNNRRLCITQ